MTMDELDIAVIDSIHSTLNQMIKDGLPEGIDAVRVDITVHSPHGWHPTVTGRITMLKEGVKFDLEGEKVDARDSDS